jgi:hypothetical protein
VGPFTERIFGDYTFERSRRFVENVTSPAVVLEMLTQPGRQFVIASADPLLKQVGEARALELVYNGQIEPLRSGHTEFIEVKGESGDPAALTE